MNALISQTALARALGVSKTTVHFWTTEGKITPEIAEGRIYRYDLEAVLAQLKARFEDQKNNKTMNFL